MYQIQIFEIRPELDVVGYPAACPAGTVVWWLLYCSTCWWCLWSCV